MQKSYKLSFLAEVIEAVVFGDPDYKVTGINSLDCAKPTDISFLSNQSYIKFLEHSKAGAIIATEKIVSMIDQSNINLLVMSNPYLGYAKISQLFKNCLVTQKKGIHKTAVICKDVVIAKDVYIGANSVIHSGVKINNGVIIGDGCSIGENSNIDEYTQIRNNTSISDNVNIGKNCIIHPGAVIGGDGFGNARDGKVWHKIEHFGGVVIGDNVEVGCNTCIDRGSIGNTVIEDGVRIDNLIQIAHNVKIGKNTAIASLAGISGGTEIGKNCMIGGGSGFAGHIKIADNVIINGMAMITKSIDQSGSYASGTGFMDVKSWRKNAVTFKKLHEIIKSIKHIIASK